MSVSQKQIIYIPHVFPHGNWREFGGAPGMKRYIRKAFAGNDSNGMVKIGCVKQVDLIDNVGKSSMMVDYSAFVHVIPSDSEQSKTIFTKIATGHNYRFTHNASRGFYWDLVLSNKSQLKKQTDKYVQTSTSTSTSNSTSNQPSQSSIPCQTAHVDTLVEAFDTLTCDNERPTKRRRMEVY